MNTTYQAYDAVLGALYQANRDERGLGSFVLGLQGILGADMASMVVFDGPDQRVSHGVCTNHHAISPRRIADWQGDMVMRSLTHRPFFAPVRLSELAPYADLAAQGWYRAQFADFGLKHCIFQDVEFGRSRIRLISQRNGHKAEFGGAEVELFGRVARHVASAGALLNASAFTNAAQCVDVQIFDLDDRMRLETRCRVEETRSRLQNDYRLSPAEARVALAFTRGESLQAVATSLRLSVNTVKVHLRHIYAKLHVRRLPELVSMLAGMSP